MPVPVYGTQCGSPPQAPPPTSPLAAAVLVRLAAISAARKGVSPARPRRPPPGGSPGCGAARGREPPPPPGRGRGYWDPPQPPSEGFSSRRPSSAPHAAPAEPAPPPCSPCPLQVHEVRLPANSPGLAAGAQLIVLALAPAPAPTASAPAPSAPTASAPAPSGEQRWAARALAASPPPLVATQPVPLQPAGAFSPVAGPPRRPAAGPCWAAPPPDTGSALLTSRPRDLRPPRRQDPAPNPQPAPGYGGLVSPDRGCKQYAAELPPDPAFDSPAAPAPAGAVQERLRLSRKLSRSGLLSQLAQRGPSASPAPGCSEQRRGSERSYVSPAPPSSAVGRASGQSRASRASPAPPPPEVPQLSEGPPVRLDAGEAAALARVQSLAQLAPARRDSLVSSVRQAYDSRRRSSAAAERLANLAVADPAPPRRGSAQDSPSPRRSSAASPCTAGCSPAGTL
eukprot:TRINITY_DN8736_c0_g1_i1.p1 TRINITY_DN8736_c0_g1~~TRINITY_DN8736_c0_g1_i1.p1  ORF type:complete len:477 (+),score=85.30 TRINITY_DN8736_c0_g1_i1:73-1431(+)